MPAKVASALATQLEFFKQEPIMHLNIVFFVKISLIMYKKLFNKKVPYMQIDRISGNVSR